MHRLFIGIDPPFEVKDRLMEVMGGIIGARWQREDQLHLTLRFIGEVDTRRANEIAECLETVSSPAFAIGLDSMGVFEKRGRPEALWIGVDPAGPARKLHLKVSRAIERIGIAPEGRAYLPHVTLARFSRGAGPLDHFMAAHGGMQIAPFDVEDFCLYESQLTQDGAVYSIIERFPFAQGALFDRSELGAGF